MLFNAIQKLIILFKTFQVVIANILEERRNQVTIVTQDNHFTISLTNEELSEGKEIEEPIINQLKEQHLQFIQEYAWWMVEDKQPKTIHWVLKT